MKKVERPRTKEKFFTSFEKNLGYKVFAFGMHNSFDIFLNRLVEAYGHDWSYSFVLCGIYLVKSKVGSRM